MLFSSNLKSTSFLDDSNQNITDTKKTEHARETDLFWMDNPIEKVDEEYYKFVNLDNKEFYQLKRTQEPQQNLETVFLNKSNPIANSSQPEPQNKETTTSLVTEASWSKRWGRDKDVLAFTILRELWSQENIVIDTFLDEDSTLTDKHYSIISELVDRLNWKRNVQTMLNRIQFLGKNQTLSVRELRLFNRLKKKAKKENKPFDLEEAANQFPGRLASTLQSYIKK